jgi:hypothetical protein
MEEDGRRRGTEDRLEVRTRRVLLVLLAVLIALTFYAIFNAGNPRSLFRYVLRDARYDVAVTLALSAGIVVLVLLLTAGRFDRLKGLLDLNRSYIEELRREGKSDGEIAESFLNELKAPAGFLRAIAKRRVLRYLSRLK